MDITVIGGGHVGLPVAAVFAEAGNRVVCCERDLSRLRLLREGRAPFDEPGLAALVGDGLRKGTLAFAEDARQAVGRAELCFMAVETAANGHTQLMETAVSIAQGMPDGSAIVLKSTMQPTTADSVAVAIGDRVRVAVNPEFLRQGHAVEDFRSPDRIVIGAQEESTLGKLRTLYSPWRDRGIRWVETSRTEAEIVKVGANCFLAARVALVNEIAGLCESVPGADVRAVRNALAADSRIGGDYLSPGIGFGGSCLPKDCELLALAGKAVNSPMALVEAVTASNRARQEGLVARIAGLARGIPEPTLTFWGLTFKPDSDDIRGSVALGIADRVAQAVPGLRLRLHDPHLQGTAVPVRGELSGDWRESLRDSDGLAVLVAHSAFREIRRKDAESLVRNGTVLDLAGALGA